MNQLETNLILWAICAILLFELLIIICLCRCFFNRIKPKRFYVKREEYGYLQQTYSKPFQSTILRPPHADELALVGTSSGHSQTSYNIDLPNVTYHSDKDELRTIPQLHSLSPPSPPLLPSSSSTTTQYHPQRLNWVELRPSNGFISTSQLSPSEYEIHSYHTPPSVSMLHLPPPPLIQHLQLSNFESHHDNIEDDDTDDDAPFHTFLPENANPQGDMIKRTDTSTDTTNYSVIIPKSILKGSRNTPPLELEQQQAYYNRPYSINDNLSSQRSRTPSRLDSGDISYRPRLIIGSTTISQPLYIEESPRTSVKVNTDESIADSFVRIDYSATLAPYDKRLTTDSNLYSRYRMKYASISQLNEIEWDVPREFQTIVYELSDEGQTIKGALLYDANDNNKNNNNNNNNNNKWEKLQRNQKLPLHETDRIEDKSPSYIVQDERSVRQRSQSAHDYDREARRTYYNRDASHILQTRIVTGSDPYISRVFVPWEENQEIAKRKILQQLNHTNEHSDEIQQAFEY
ncbi:unnamed protein product [Didymodactylos carnosus]|uniref:Uncharacterized protein n=1 Tax=Didymodactylos carnosus TaxID=1234261 RepID=A0A813UMW9_9BILA|nr:unnamed protein product [Didymodactylos carnosus]CAF0825654.1 unnamed protein product [Didymodactylos carnosus]CAF3542959.1 unnamed protein product [Didymodactylos carnosus]CAF3612409.1 unnamed protein product [Didymodactylos carnosus]